MTPYLSLVTLGVADLARSRAFYRALGFVESSASQAEVAFFQAGGVAISLFGHAALAEDAGVDPAGGGGFTGFSLAHNVASGDAVDAVLREAVAAGARLVRAGEQAPWGGYRGYFADPDGFLWEVCHNPFFPLDARGTVQLPP
ncbi:MAG: hypothetical protein RJA36_1023 [Pseudomonadota bacterium]|jgi:catechol 2,3-dioxygenase-like lactoylglutathione lyase family enzyme